MSVQTTLNVNNTTALMKEIYDRQLLETAKTMFVYANFGQKRPQPRNSGKTVKFRRWTLFTPSTTTLKLTEGLKPSSQSLGQTEVSATIEQYGAYVEVSDLLDLTAYDPVIDDCNNLLGEQLGITMDWVARDAMILGASAQYAGGRNSMLGIKPTDKMTVAEIRKAVRTLKKAKARRFTDGGKPHFVCIFDPDCGYDMQSDTLWQDVSKYSNAEQIYDGEIGRMFGVVFVESTEGKVTEQSVLNAVNAATTASAAFVLKNDPSEAEVAYLSTGGKKIKIGSTEYTLADSGSYTASTKTVTLSAAATLTADAIVFSEDAGECNSSTEEGTPIHHTLMFGADAYGLIDIDGSGTIQSIIKPHGSGDDPLNQIATVGAKVLGYCVKVLNELWIIDIMSAAS